MRAGGVNFRAVPDGGGDDESAERETMTGGGASAGMHCPVARGHSATTQMLSEWLLNSGAYMHWMPAKPVW